MRRENGERRTENREQRTENREQRTEKWPKNLPPLTPEQQRIVDDFTDATLEAFQTKWYGVVERFNQTYPLRSFSPGCRTLEIGAGLGLHLKYEDLRRQYYHCLELMPQLCEKIADRYGAREGVEGRAGVKVSCGDCQEPLPYPDEHFDRILAINVLEHLPNLPAALKEMHRTLKARGRLSVVIPCEGSLAHRLARSISTRPHFEKRYGQSHDFFIRRQHINVPDEIMEELGGAGFVREHRRYYPLAFMPFKFCNLLIGLTFVKKG